MSSDVEKAQGNNGFAESHLSEASESQRDNLIRSYKPEKRQFYRSRRFTYTLAVIALVSVVVAVATPLLLRAHHRKPSAPPGSTATRISASSSTLSTLDTSSTVSNPGDGGPSLCAGDQVPITDMDPFSGLFGPSGNQANNASQLEIASNSTLPNTDAPETRRPHRVNIRFKSEFDPILKLAEAVEAVEEMLSGDGNGTRSVNGTSSGNGSAGQVKVSVDKIKAFLKGKCSNGWMLPDQYAGWFKDIPGMDTVMEEVKKVYYGPHSRALILDFESPAVAKTVAGILSVMGELVEVSMVDVPIQRKDVALSVNGPNDPLFGNQWGLASVGVVENVDTQTPGAWAASTGDKGIIVAVVDTGVDYKHPDLATNMWINEGEIPDNGVDDDNNGYVDDYYGYNFVEGALNPSDPMDDHYHGTHVAGIIGAVGNNDLGISGVATNVSIMALKILDSSGKGATSWNIQAMEYALNMGADILSASLGGYDEDPILSRIFDVASDNGMLLVAAAGNERTNTDEKAHFPSAGDQATLISVAASVETGCMAGFSNYGTTTVDIVAPGDNIMSTIPTGFRAANGYGRLSGTSQATPFVAGAAALVMSYMKQSGRPYKGQGVAVKDLLLRTARKNSLYTDFVASGGALDVGRAMEEAANTTFTPRPPPPPPTAPARNQGPSNPFEAIFSNDSPWLRMGPWVYMACTLVALSFVWL